MKRRRACAWALSAGFGLAACLALGCSDSGPAESALERVAREGVARVGYANEAPYAFLEPTSGELSGEAPTIARAVLEQLGVTEIEGVLTEFGSLIPALRARRMDLIAAGMYITPERCERIAFSNPTYSIGGAFLVREGNPLDLHSYEDVRDNPEVRFGVMGGAVESGYARRVGIPDEQLVVFPDPPSGLEGVRSDRVDAFAVTVLTGRDLLSKQSGGVEMADPFSDPVIDGVPARGYGAFGFHVEDTELRDAFDRALERFIGTPAHLEAIRPFGFGESELPGDVTAAQLCAG